MAIRFVVCCAAILGILVVADPVRAATSSSGIVCVSLMEIKASPAINDKIVLLQLRNGEYKRIDLVASCPEIMFRGFSFVTHTEELCTVDALRIIQSEGELCAIKDIIDITKEQALALQKTDKR